MSSIVISCIVFACIFAGTVLGMILRAFLPEHHLSSESKEVVKLGSKGANNTYIGKTDIEYGTLRLANGAAPGADTGALQVGGNGELDLNGCSVTVGSLNDGTSGTGGLITDNSLDENYGGITWLTVATPYGESHIFHGSIQDSRVAPVIGLVMSGKGTLTLAGANGYVGGTEINDGTLELVAPTTGTALPYGPLSVNSPGMLDLNGESIEVSTLDGSGTIFDNSNPGPTTVLKVTMSRPCVFAGVIENGLVAGGQQHVVGLNVTGDGPLTLTGDSSGGNVNAYCLGTEISHEEQKGHKEAASGKQGKPPPSFAVPSCPSCPLWSIHSLPALAAAGGSVPNNSGTSEDSYAIWPACTEPTPRQHQPRRHEKRGTSLGMSQALEHLVLAAAAIPRTRIRALVFV